MYFYHNRRLWTDEITSSKLNDIFLITRGYSIRNEIFDLIISEWIIKIEGYDNGQLMREVKIIKETEINKDICLYFYVRDDIWDTFKEVTSQIGVNLSKAFKIAVEDFHEI